MKKKIVCFCEAEFNADIPKLVDFSKEPEIEEDILKGKFMAVTCPACGKLIKPEFPVHIIYPSREMDIFFIPELDRMAFLRDKLEYKVVNSKRVVIGYDELVEKILLFKNDLNDRVIEIIKYYLLKKALEDSESDMEVRILFYGKEGNSLIFHAKGLRKSEVGILRVDMGMVEKVTLQLENKKNEEPFLTILEAPYVSINKILSGVDA